MKKPLPTIIPALALVVASLLLSAPASATTSCTKPGYVTSAKNGMWNNGGYVVANDMWNTSGYAVSQTLSACSYHNWHVSAKADNSSGDGAVKTYPNVHKDYINWNTGAQPALSSFATIRSSFTAATPKTGTYDAAYDVWLDGLHREVMIWTYNRGQHPAGTRVASNLSLGDRTWNVYATSDNGYIAFVPTHTYTHGLVHVGSMLHWLTSHKRLPTSAKLAQIGFGFEVVSTGGSASTFTVRSFSVATTRR